MQGTWSEEHGFHYFLIERTTKERKNNVLGRSLFFFRYNKYEFH